MKMGRGEEGMVKGWKLVGTGVTAGHWAIELLRAGRC